MVDIAALHRVENHSRFVSVVRQQFLAGRDLAVVPPLAVARAAAASETFDAVLVDFDLDDGTGDEPVRQRNGSKMREMPQQPVPGI